MQEITKLHDDIRTTRVVWKSVPCDRSISGYW